MLKLDDLIAVTWVDQNSYTETTNAKGALSTAVGVTIGFFLEENKDWICFAMERMKISCSEEQAYRHSVSIPKCCITEIVLLNRGKKIKPTRRLK